MDARETCHHGPSGQVEGDTATRYGLDAGERAANIERVGHSRHRIDDAVRNPKVGVDGLRLSKSR